MTDHTSVTPQNLVPLNRARLCAESHIYDTALWNGPCPCGTEQGVMLEEILSKKKKPGAENSGPKTRKAARRVET